VWVVTCSAKIVECAAVSCERNSSASCRAASAAPDASCSSSSSKFRLFDGQAQHVLQHWGLVVPTNTLWDVAACAVVHMPGSSRSNLSIQHVYLTPHTAHL
jgi:hypothetical protein